MLLPLLTSPPPPAPTSAPALRTAAACYLPHQAVNITGERFTPGMRYEVTLDRVPLGSGSVGADGKLSGTLPSGTLPAAGLKRRHVIAVHDGKVDAHAGFDVSAFGANFTPSTGDPKTLRVRFSANGIGVATHVPARVWLHYLDPRGHLRKTLSLGLTSGPCGSLVRSPRLALFPFHNIRAGRWKLQFDLRRSYSSATQPRIRRLVAVR